jgi:tetratricopeptide (TPR) repeat protein
MLTTLALIVMAALAIFIYFSRMTKGNKKEENKTRSWKPLALTALAAILLLAFVSFQLFNSATAPDTQCSTSQTPTSLPPVSLTTAMDYFMQGNYDYERGNCDQAITDYTKSIELKPDYPQAYNNRAYTHMRMQDYKSALPDLDRAILLNPDYIQALMNRGDIYNYYYEIDRQKAIADYKRVISLGGKDGTSVCGHLFLANHNGWSFGTILDLPWVLAGFCE